MNISLSSNYLLVFGGIHLLFRGYFWRYLATGCSTVYEGYIWEDTLTGYNYGYILTGHTVYPGIFSYKMH
jgi:hypothetical protein